MYRGNVREFQVLIPFSLKFLEIDGLEEEPSSVVGEDSLVGDSNLR